MLCFIDLALFLPLSLLQAWADNKVPAMPPGGEMPKERKVEPKGDGKKKSQADMEQEMAALQYSNPDRKSTRLNSSHL